MTEVCHSSPALEVDAATDFQATIASLRAAGADRFDPVQLHYLETLALHTTSQVPGVQRLLNAKLTKALEDFTTRFELARDEALDAITRTAAQHPHATAALQRQLEVGDFAGVQQSLSALKASQPRESLKDLARALAQQSLASAPAGREEHPGARPELKSVQQFRNTWSKLSVDRQVNQALHQAPANAGPINSHMLVLRSLTLMRDLSPDYLNRFISYADTLLCLDQGELKKPVTAKDTAGGENAKKLKTRRGRAR